VQLHCGGSAPLGGRLGALSSPRSLATAANQTRQPNLTCWGRSCSSSSSSSSSSSLARHPFLVACLSGQIEGQPEDCLPSPVACLPPASRPQLSLSYANQRALIVPPSSGRAQSAPAPVHCATSERTSAPAHAARPTHTQNGHSKRPFKAPIQSGHAKRPRPLQWHAPPSIDTTLWTVFWPVSGASQVASLVQLLPIWLSPVRLPAGLDRGA